MSLNIKTGICYPAGSNNLDIIRVKLGAKLLGFDDNKNLSHDQIKVLKKQQMLTTSATSSYSELFKNANLLKEEQEKKLQRSISFQIISTLPQQNSLPWQPENKNVRSQSLDFDDRIAKRDVIVVNSQEEYYFQGWDLFPVKREEMMDEENAVVTNCSQLERKELNENNISTNRAEKSSDFMLMEPESNERESSTTNKMDIELHDDKPRDSSMLIEANDQSRTNFSDFINEIIEEDCNEKEPVNRSENRSRLDRKKSILKKNRTSESISERLSLSSRSNSRSEKRVRFEGLSDEEEDEEGEVDDSTSKKSEKQQDPRRSQISVISKMLQKRLEKEEQSRGITNVTNFMSMPPQMNIIEKKSSIEEKKVGQSTSRSFGLASKEKNPILSKPFSLPGGAIQKDTPSASPASTAVSRGSKRNEDPVASKEEKKDSVNMSELWKSINTKNSSTNSNISNNNSKKKVIAPNPDRSRLSFFASAPSSREVDTQAKSPKQTNEIVKKPPLNAKPKTFDILSGFV